MVSDIIEQLNSCLGELETKINNLEKSPYRIYELVEYDTISLFHKFNLSFKDFIKEFDRSSASHLLSLEGISKRHLELSNRYEKLLNSQINYLKECVNYEGNFITDYPPVTLTEYNSKEVLDYYIQNLDDEKDSKGKPLYKIGINKNDLWILFDLKEPQKAYQLQSDQINEDNHRTFFKLLKNLMRIHTLMCVVCEYPDDKIFDFDIKVCEIINALEKGLRKYAHEVGRDIERDLKRIAQKLKTHRNAPLTPDVWGRVMDWEDEMYNSAINTQVGEVDDKYLENIGTTVLELTSNYSLLQKIKSTCLDDELFDIELSINTHNLLSSLNADNLDVFYELVLRRNIIQREMFPDQLRDKYEEWLNKSDEQQDATTEREELSEARQSKLTEIIEILKRGNWKEPATTDNIEQLLNTVFGKDTSLLDDDDKPQCEKIWGLVESGRGKREIIVSANLAGYFAEQSLLKGSPKVISNDLYGKNNDQSSNINKGKEKNCSPSFAGIVPFLNKYINKIIRQK